VSVPMLSPEQIREATQWQARLWSDDATEEDIAACARWRQGDPAHEYAWQQLQQLQSQFDAVPAASGRRILGVRQGLSRRQLLAVVGLLGGSASLAGVGTRQQWQPLLADQRTGTGEMRSLRLNDGTRLQLNTATSLNLHSNASGHQVQLLQGELLIDSPEHAWPLQLDCRDARITARNSRLCLRQNAEDSLLTVLAGSADLQLQQQQSSVTLSAGKAVRFSRQGIAPTQAANPNQLAWTTGRLVAERQSLPQFVSELARYHPGVLRVAPGLADLHLTGVFSLKDTHATLARLPTVLPVKLRYISRYWVSVEPA